MKVFRLWALLSMLAFSTAAFSHSDRPSYIDLRHDSNGLQGHLSVPLAEIKYALNLDAINQRSLGEITIKSHQAEIMELVTDHFQLEDRNSPCRLHWQQPTTITRRTVAYLQLSFNAECPPPALMDPVLNVSFSMFFDFNPWHHGYLTFQGKDGKYQAVFSPDKTEIFVTTLSKLR